MVAKSSNLYTNQESNTMWRISFSPMDLINESVYSGCNIVDVLVMLKDVRIIALSQFSRSDFSSHHIKICLLWCIEEFEELNRQQLLECILDKLSYFYQIHFLPDFFDKDCNLIGHVKEGVAVELSFKIKEVRKNIDFWFEECAVQQTVLRQCYKEGISTFGSFQTHLLKLFLGLMLKCRFIGNYLFFRISSRYLIRTGWPEDSSSLLFRNNDPKLKSLCTKMIKAVIDTAINLLK